jgi:hypothetical protein
MYTRIQTPGSQGSIGCLKVNRWRMLFHKHGRDTSSYRFWSRYVAAALTACLVCVAVAVVVIRWAYGRVVVPDKATREVLVVLDGASRVERGPAALGSFYVAYSLTEEYPASNTIQQISSRLRTLGWMPLNEDWLNPGLASSHVCGWTDFLDMTKSPPQHVHQWLAQWKNSSGNIAVYSLRYSYPDGAPPNLHLLWINGTCYSAASVKMIK